MAATTMHPGIAKPRTSLMLRGMLELFRVSAVGLRLEVGVADAFGKSLAVLPVIAGSIDDDAILLEGTEVASVGTAATLALVVTKAGVSDTGATETLVAAKSGASYVVMVEILVELVDLSLVPPRVLVNPSQE